MLRVARSDRAGAARAAGHQAAHSLQGGFDAFPDRRLVRAARQQRQAGDTVSTDGVDPDVHGGATAHDGPVQRQRAPGIDTGGTARREQQAAVGGAGWVGGGGRLRAVRGAGGADACRAARTGGGDQWSLPCDDRRLREAAAGEAALLVGDARLPHNLTLGARAPRRRLPLLPRRAIRQLGHLPAAATRREVPPRLLRLWVAAAGLGSGAETLPWFAGYFGRAPAQLERHMPNGWMTGAMLNEFCQVFETSAWDDVLEQLRRRTLAGGVAYATAQLTVLPNAHQGVHGGQVVKSVWLVNEGLEEWRRLLPGPSASLVADYVEADEFPHIENMQADSTSRSTHHPKLRTAYLSNLATWNMLQLTDELRALVAHASAP